MNRNMWKGREHWQGPRQEPNEEKIVQYALNNPVPFGHSYISPSNLHKYLHCPASPGREFLVEKRAQFLAAMGSENPAVRAIFEKDEEAAGDGTFCHELYEKYCSSFEAGLDSNSDWLYENVCNEVNEYASRKLADDLDFINKFTKVIFDTKNMLKNAAWFLQEQKVVLKKYAMWGTVDLVFQTGNTLHVWDLKTGRQEVAAENNPQLLAYALGLLEALGWKGISELQLGIVGIRFPMSMWNTTLDAVLKFRNEVLEPKLKEAYALGSKGKPGACCMYCNAKLWCKEFNDRVSYTQGKGDFIEGEDSFKELDNTTLVDRFLLSKQIERFQNDAKNEIALRYEGFGSMEEETRVKYIRPTAITEFKDDEAAVEKIEEFLGEEAKPFVRKKAVNPTRLKGLLTEEQYGELVTEKARKPYVKMA